MPELDPMLSNPENSKTVIQMPPRSNSLAAIDTVAKLEAVKAEGGAGATEIQYAPGTIGAVMTGGMPIKPLFASGDPVYDKRHKKEGVVRRLGADGTIRVKYSNGIKAWVKSEYLVKL